MEIRRLDIHNYRGIRQARILLPKHAVLIGDNNTGKTTLLEAMDLVLGPDRLNRFPPIDEHDFFEGRYTAPPDDAAGQDDGNGAEALAQAGDEAEPVEEMARLPEIKIEAVIIDLSEEQQASFGNYAEWWDKNTNEFYVGPNPAGVDAPDIIQALRVTFLGRYDPEEGRL